MKFLDSKEKVDHVVETLTHEKIMANCCKPLVSSYMESKDTRDVININKPDIEIKTMVSKINQLYGDIDAITAGIER